MRSADPTDVPPNFITKKLMAFLVSIKSVHKHESHPPLAADGGFQILILAELPHPLRAPVVPVVVVVVVQTTTWAGVGAGHAVRIGWWCFNSLVRFDVVQ